MAKSQSESRRVGGQQQQGSGSEKADKKASKKRVAFTPAKKSDYPFEKAIPDGFDFKVNKPLKKKDFKSTAAYLEHTAAELRFKAEQMTAKAGKLETKAKQLAAMGDEKQAKVVKKGLRVINALADLEKQLKEAGLTMDQLKELAKPDSEEEGEEAKA
jgi:hypothetical protein